MADNGKICIHLVFSRGNSASIQNKVHEFWSFLDAENYLLPAYSQCLSTKATKLVIGIFGVVINKVSRQKTDSTITLNSESSIKEEERGKVQNRFWHKQFKNFRRLGLDRAALATATRCKTCHVDTRCSDYADTVDPSYEELSEEMEAFDRRTSNL